MSYIDVLNAAADKATVASDRAELASQLLHDVANGDENATVTTASGEVLTVANAIKKVQEDIALGSVAPIIEVQTLTETDQTSVVFQTLNTNGLAIYIEDTGGSFHRYFNFEVISNNSIILGDTFAVGTEVTGVAQEIGGAVGTAVQQTDANAQLAEDWAIKLGATVDGVEYSSKYHAQASATSETNAANSASAASTSETNALASEQKAFQWAEEVDGVPVAVDSSATTWLASTAYSLGDLVVPTVSNGYYYEVTTAGTTASTEPTWPTTLGSTVTDGSVVWTTRALLSAQHHAGKAEASATAASASEAAASTSETNAAASESAAATSETNAATSETNAAASETAAATSASEALDARDQTIASSNIFADPAAGIAGTVDGEFFHSVATDDEGYITIYKNEAGVATEITTYPSKVYFDNLDKWNRESSTRFTRSLMKLGDIGQSIHFDFRLQSFATGNRAGLIYAY